MNDEGLLTPEEMSQVIQQDTGKWAVTNKEFLMDCANVIAKAQLAKVQKSEEQVRKDEKERMLKIVAEYGLDTASVRDDVLERQAIGWQALRGEK